MIINCLDFIKKIREENQDGVVVLLGLDNEFIWEDEVYWNGLNDMCRKHGVEIQLHPENNLHRSKHKAILTWAKEMVAKLTHGPQLIITHSCEIISEMKPEHVYNIHNGEFLNMTDLFNRQWPECFDLGDLYLRGELRWIEANK